MVLRLKMYVCANGISGDFYPVITYTLLCAFMRKRTTIEFSLNYVLIWRLAVNTVETKRNELGFYIFQNCHWPQRNWRLFFLCVSWIWENDIICLNGSGIHHTNMNRVYGDASNVNVDKKKLSNSSQNARKLKHFFTTIYS